MPYSVASSPAPPQNPTFSPFRSLRSLLPFGPSKNPSSDAVPATPPRGSFSGFSSMRKSLSRDRERKTSLNNLLPVISIDRSSAPDLSLPPRRSVSFSHFESDFGENNAAAPVLRSISPGPPLSADLSTIIEADSSGISRDAHPSPSTEASLELSPKQIAKQVYEAISGEDQWLVAAESAIVIDAEDTDDAADDDENEPTEVLPPLPDNTSINIDNVDPSIVALLSPNSLPHAKSSPGRATPTSIPRLRPMTPRSSSSDTTPTANTRRLPSYSHSPLSSSSLTVGPESLPTRITVTTTTPEKSVLPRLFGPQHHPRSLTPLTRSHSAHAVSSAPPTPSSLSNRLQVLSSSSETHLRTPSPVHTPQQHSPHTPQTPRTPQLVPTQGSSASSASTAPNTPSSPHSSSHTRIPSSISRQTSESSSTSVIAHRFRAYHHHQETSASSVGSGRASLDSHRPQRLQPAAPVPDHHLLATSTPFRRSSEDAMSDLDTVRRRREREREQSLLPDSPSALKPPQVRSRKRSMSVQDSFRAAQSLIAGRRPTNPGSRSHSSMSGRALTASARIHARGDDEDEDATPQSHDRRPMHDWLGPRSVKALRAAGLLEDRERDHQDHQLVLAGRNSRERSGSVATSVMSGASSSKTTGSGARSAFSALGHGRAPSRMAFSDVGGPSSRRASGSGLMHSPTLTTSTAPTSVSSPSMVYQRERDEVQEMKERHATETGALLSALSDSQRTTRVLREENHELRGRLERLGDLEVVNDNLRVQVRNLKREVGELKLKLQVRSTPIPDVVLPPEPETPKLHRRVPSDTSSIFPVVPSNMTMLMHDEDHQMHAQLSDDQGDQTRTTIGSKPISFRRPVAPVVATPPASGRNGTTSVSPATANFSMVTGSPGSLFLRPEHEVHLGDLDTFSLDMGRVEESDAMDDW